MSNKNLILDALTAGEGVVRLAPCWVPRSFLMPGGRLKLDPRDLYALGAHRGGIDERWFSSTTKAANGPLTGEDEGLSYIEFRGKKALLKEAIETEGDRFLGADVMKRYGGWNLLCKFFDNLGPIPHHLHQNDEFARRVGQNGKPEAYYFPRQYNFTGNSFPYTFMGLNPGTTKDDIRECLKRWNEGKTDELWREAKTLYEGRDTGQRTSAVPLSVPKMPVTARLLPPCSLGSCPVTEEAVKEMKEKHPQAPKPTLPLGSLPDAVRFEPDVVRRKVEGFPTGSAAGASGARPQFFKDMLAVPTRQWAALLCLRSQL